MRISVMSSSRMEMIRTGTQDTGEIPVYASLRDRRVQIAAILRSGQGWKIRCEEGCRFLAIDPLRVRQLEQTELPLQPGTPCSIQVESRELVRLLPDEDPQEDQTLPLYALPTEGTLLMGGDRSCAVRWDGFGVDGPVLQLVVQAGGVQVKNLERAPWLLYCRGAAVSRARLEPGDWVYFAGLWMTAGAGFLQLSVPDGRAHVALEPLTAARCMEQGKKQNASFHIAPSHSLLPQRDAIRVQPPPGLQEEVRQPVGLLAMLPSTLMAFAMLVTMITTATSGKSIGTLFSSMLMVMCVVLSLMVPVFSRRQARRQAAAQKLRKEENYREYLKQLSQNVQHECEVERFNLLLRNPPLDGEGISLSQPGGGSCLVLSCTARSAGDGWKGLWERLADDPDFLCVQVGTGDFAPACRLEKPEPTAIGPLPPLYQEMEQAVQELPILHQAPVVLDLKADRLVGIVGRNRDDVVRQTIGMLVELTALHSYEDLRIVLIYGEKERTSWEFAKWMPHVWREDGRVKYIANDLSEIKSLSQMLLETYRARRESGATPEHRRWNPWYLIVHADQELGRRAEALRELYGCQENLGITLLELCESEKQLPKNCTAIVDLDRSALQLRRGGTVQEQRFSTSVCYTGDALALFTNMSRIRLNDVERGTGFPESLSFLEMEQAGNTRQLNILHAWRTSDPVHTLAATIGRDRDGFAVTLDLHQKAHGPHGLVAGTTGSGKSELLISMILDYAIHYRPDEVAFVLIDFKGGGMADVFRGLPHLAGCITNLDGNALRRSFLAIESELERRQQSFQQVTQQLHLNSVDIYTYQSLYREGRVAEPMPHLILVADEFAELKNQQGDFMEQLIRIARIGRSLGIHLILATQKPDGVVDEQIRSNVRFRICLKVQDKSDSMAVLDTPDAAQLAQAGRFYLKVGMNEIYELGQSGYSGTPYQPRSRYEPSKDLAVDLLDEQGRVKRSAAPSRPLENPDRKEVTAVLEAVAAAAQAEKYTQHFLWAEPLAMVQEGTDQLDKPKEDRCAVQVGEYDDLFERRHKPVFLSLSSLGHGVVYGAAGSGKSDFVCRVLIECMKKYTPEQVQFYLADAESGTLQAYQGGSHTAFVALAGEYDRYEEMLQLLHQELERRRVLLQPFGGDLERYLDSGHVLPYCLCVVQDLGGFTGGPNGGELLDRLRELARVGKKYGLTLLLTGTDERSVHYSLRSLLPQVYVLRMTNADEYASILGRTQGMTPSDGRGRGLIRCETPGRGKGYSIYEFQVDVPFAHAANPYEEICALVQSISQKYGSTAPAEEQVPQDLEPDWFDRFPCTREAVPVAVCRDGTPVLWNFQADPLLQCSLPSEMGLVRGLIGLLARACAGGMVCVLDGTGQCGPLPAEHVKVYAGQDCAGAVNDFFDRMNEQFQQARAQMSAGQPMHLSAMGLVVIAPAKLLTQLDAAGAARLNNLLAYRSKSGKFPIYDLVFSEYAEGLRCPLPALEPFRPIRDGLVLEQPRQGSQYLFESRQVEAGQVKTGVLRQGILSGCRFAAW